MRACTAIICHMLISASSSSSECKSRRKGSPPPPSRVTSPFRPTSAPVSRRARPCGRSREREREPEASGRCPARISPALAGSTSLRRRPRVGFLLRWSRRRERPMAVHALLGRRTKRGSPQGSPWRAEWRAPARVPLFSSGSRAVLKTVVPVIPGPRVRIPPPPSYERKYLLRGRFGLDLFADARRFDRPQSGRFNRKSR